MSTEINEEFLDVFVTNPEDSAMVAIRAQIKVGQVVRAYLDALEKFESANADLAESCQGVRAVIKPNTTLVVRLDPRHNGKHYLLKSTDQGDFEVKLVDVIY